MPVSGQVLVKKRKQYIIIATIPAEQPDVNESMNSKDKG